MLLARAGIGSLTLAHGGHVITENLNRMHLANTNDVNRPYIKAFLEKLNDINPNVELRGIPDNINQDNVDDLVSHCDIVADGSPSFEERYLMNQAAITYQKPMISGAMYDLEGYVTTIISPRTPCLACVYPNEPASWTTTCFPVIAPISSLIGSIMAMEVIKLVTGLGETLQGRLWRFDLRSNWAKQFVISKRENCVVCGTQPYASG
jgi:molybdopterin/thiamine biosynthesis adenylyltransferase